jgi:hypothetical protein
MIRNIVVGLSLLMVTALAVSSYANDTEYKSAALTEPFDFNASKAPISRPPNKRIAFECYADYCSSNSHCCSYGSNVWCCLNSTSCGTRGDCY